MSGPNGGPSTRSPQLPTVPVNQATSDRDYLDVNELAARTGLSKATIWRLKRKRLIPFFQPGGKGTTVLFPKDAVEQVNQGSELTGGSATPKDQDCLPGPKPGWMSAAMHLKEKT